MLRIAAPLLIVAAGVIAYHNCLHGGLLFDDLNSVRFNQHIHKLWPLRQTLTTEPQDVLTARPIVQLSFAINYAIGGLNVVGYHLGNVAIHIVCGLLIYGIVKRTIRSDGVALAGALLFVVHPLNTECVSYITQRTESMMAMFALLTLYCFIRRWYWASIIACLLGMGCKEVMAVVPFLVLVYDRIFIARTWKEVKWKWHAGLWLTLLPLLYAYRSNPRSDLSSFHLTALTPWKYLMTQSGVLVHYLRLVFWPRPLVVDYYDWPVAQYLSDVLPYACMIIGLLVTTVVLLFKRPRLAFPFVVFFIALAPTSSIVPIVGEMAAERRMYLPMAALMPLAAIVGYALLQKVTSGRQIAVAGALVTLSLCAAMSWACVERNYDYRSADALFTKAIAERPGNGRAWANLAAVQYENKEFDLALEAVERATQLEPDMVPALRLAGELLSKKGEHEEAMRYLRAALQRKKESATVREIAKAEMRAGNRDVALRWFRAAEKLKPEAETEDAYGYALAQAGRFDDAIGEFNAALSKDPKLADAHYNRGLVRAMRGDADGAKADLHRAIEEDGKRYDAMTKLAWIVATSPESLPDEVSQAIEFAGRAVKQSPEDAETLDTFAAALARGGKFDQASEVASRAQYRAALAGNKPMADVVGRRIALYRQGKPYIPGASVHGK